MVYQRVTDALPTDQAAAEALAGRIETAAKWLAENYEVASRPINRALREGFGLTFADAVKAQAQARRLILASRDR